MGLSVYDQKRVIVGDLDFVTTDIEIAFNSDIPAGVTRIIASVPRGCEEGWRLAVKSFPVVEWPQHVVVVLADGRKAKAAMYADDTPTGFADRVALAIGEAAQGVGIRLPWGPRTYVAERDVMLGPAWEVRK